MDSKPQPPARPQPVPIEDDVDDIRAGLRLANAIYWAVYGDQVPRNGGGR